MAFILGQKLRRIDSNDPGDCCFIFRVLDMKLFYPSGYVKKTSLKQQICKSPLLHSLLSMPVLPPFLPPGFVRPIWLKWKKPAYFAKGFDEG